MNSSKKLVSSLNTILNNLDKELSINKKIYIQEKLEMIREQDKQDVKFRKNLQFVDDILNKMKYIHYKKKGFVLSDDDE
jgi:ABC-type lipopolysaccharide export system ATPase subunit